MKKTISVLLIATMMIAMIIVSCNSALEKEQLGQLIFLWPQSKDLNTGSDTDSIDSLYWFYRAEKKDTGIYRTGELKEFTPLNVVGGNHAPGLPTLPYVLPGSSGNNKFSYGSWEFELVGLRAANGTAPEKPSSSGDVAVVYKAVESTVINAENNYISFALKYGSAGVTKITFGEIVFEYATITSTDSFIALMKDQNTSNHLNASDGYITRSGSHAVASNGKVTIPAGYWSDIVITDANQMCQHTFEITLIQQDTNVTGAVNELIQKVATATHPFNVQEGHTVTISGSLNDLEQQGQVYMAYVGFSIAASNVHNALNLGTSSESNAVSVAKDVSIQDLTVSYPAGAVVKVASRNLVSGQYLTDATIGFEFKSKMRNPGNTMDRLQYAVTVNTADANTANVVVKKVISKGLTNIQIFKDEETTALTGTGQNPDYTYDQTSGLLTLHKITKDCTIYVDYE